MGEVDAMRRCDRIGWSAGLALSLCCLGPATRAAEKVAVRVDPRRVTLRLGESCRLKATVRGTRERDVRWQVEGEGAAGTVSERGIYTAPAVATTPTAIRVRATAVADAEAVGEALVQIPAVRLRVEPERLTVPAGRAVRLRARVEGAPDERVTWSVDGGPENGQMNGSGLYTAPARVATSASITVRATSVADPSKSATATLSIADVDVSVEPREATVRLGEGQAFQARVGGAEQSGVTWSVLEAEGGQVSDTGRYRTPAKMRTPATVTVAVTSVVDPNKRALARVKIPAVSVEVSPTGAPRDRHRRSAGIGATVYKVVRITLPLDPLDTLASFPLFRGRSGNVYVPAGGDYQLSAEVRNAADGDVIWSVEGGDENGTISKDGLYHAPTRLTTPRVVHVRAISAADPDKSAVALLHIPPIWVEPSPARAGTLMGAAVQLRAEAHNSEDESLLWSVDGGEKNGSVSDTGLYRPPEHLATPATVVVRATSAADRSKSAEIRVTIPAVAIRVHPGEQSLRPGETVRFRADVDGSEERGVRWEIEPRLGRIGDDGLYVAPDSDAERVVQVTAISLADPTKRATATVRLRGR